MTLPISSVTNLSSLKHSSHSRKNVSVLSEGSVFVRAFCRVPSSTFLSSRTLNIRRNSLSVSMTNSVTKKSNSNGWVGRNATMYIRKSLVIGSPKDSLVDSSQFGFPDSPPDCLERSVTLPPAEEPHVNGPLTIDLTASNARPILGGMSSCDSKEDNEGVPDHSDFRTDNSQPTSSNKLKALFKKRASVSPLNGNNNNNNTKNNSDFEFSCPPGLMSLISLEQGQLEDDYDMNGMGEGGKNPNELAWKMLKDPVKVRNHSTLNSLLKELGLSDAVELQYCTIKDLNRLASTLKDIPQRMFRNLYNL
mmetsp:Transcript_30678/g.31218  ORF Transcript_30678/g.31218 Transcript_30678/m.31218 type:complete len:306 (-) Transcript_30678:174-1091(-)